MTDTATVGRNIMTDDHIDDLPRSVRVQNRLNAYNQTVQIWSSFEICDRFQGLKKEKDVFLIL